MSFSPYRRSINDLSRVFPRPGDEGVGSSPARPGPRVLTVVRRLVGGVLAAVRPARASRSQQAPGRSLYDHDAASLTALARVVADVASPPQPRRISIRADQPTPVGLATTP